jgi:hypothetical protein
MESTRPAAMHCPSCNNTHQEQQTIGGCHRVSQHKRNKETAAMLGACQQNKSLKWHTHTHMHTLTCIGCLCLADIVWTQTLYSQ